MEFWNMNSKLPKDYVRDASEQANVARINRMLCESRGLKKLTLLGYIALMGHSLC